MKRISSILGICFAVLFFTQCGESRQNPASSSDEDAKLFVENCARCHLSNGRGGPAPGTLNAPDIRQFHKTASELQDIITNGFGKMPSFKDSLSDEKISRIATYVAARIEYRSGPSQ